MKKIFWVSIAIMFVAIIASTEVMLNSEDTFDMFWLDTLRTVFWLALLSIPVQGFVSGFIEGFNKERKL
jgi:hypothetical protein